MTTATIIEFPKQAPGSEVPAEKVRDDDRQDVEAAASMLKKAVLQSRLFCSTFEADGEPRISATDARLSIELILEELNSASWKLFAVSDDSVHHRASQAALERLWNCIDLAILMDESLKGRTFPKSRGVTMSPIYGGALILRGWLARVLAPIKGYLVDNAQVGGAA